ncbi:MAG: VWA domain-containing protein [Deltaproteobacteria bacterium]|nr:MAG: VWA domain-containing protein [Deltaproteobacteria bacterium]
MRRPTPLRARRAPRLLFALALLVAPQSPASDSPVRIRIDSPRSGAEVQNRVHLAPIRGSASAEGDGPAEFDVMIAIDVSQSTRIASGVDVDGDGVVGVNPHFELLAPGAYPDDVQSTDPEDTILAAEIAAAHALLGSLDPKRVRVGILSFGGEVNPATLERRRPDQKDAWLETPLTSDFDHARRVLDAIEARGPRGATNFAAGIRLAITELAGLSGTRSAPRPDAKKVVLFLTDGVPTFPIGKANVSDPGDLEAAVNAANLAHQAGITINTYALGPGALNDPLAPTEIARVTLGTFTPVMNPGDIVVLLQSVTFANIEDVVFTNLTTQDFSTDVRLAPDGNFMGFVPVKEGRNRVRVTALASDGTRSSVELELDFTLAGLTDRELARELERIQQRNAELERLLELERIKRFREQQRKIIEFERDTGSAEPTD